jgi:glutamate-1-semialdehyde aminotransferase
MPIAFLTGKKEIMELFTKDVFFYTTFGGEALSLAATKATLLELKSKNVPANLAEKGKYLKDGYNQLAEELGVKTYTQCKGYPCRTTVTLEATVSNPLDVKAYFQQEMIKRGVLWQGNHNMMYVHSQEDLDYTLSVYREVLPLVKQAIENGDVISRLRGKSLEAVFRKVDNFNMKPVR